MRRSSKHYVKSFGRDQDPLLYLYSSVMDGKLNDTDRTPPEALYAHVTVPGINVGVDRLSRYLLLLLTDINLIVRYLGLTPNWTEQIGLKHLMDSNSSWTQRLTAQALPKTRQRWY
jgi:hypothetical protein